MSAHAQEEIRVYATPIGEEIVAKWVPNVWEAFLDYRKNSIRLSRIEAEIISAIVTNAYERARSLAIANGVLTLDSNGNSTPNRELSELEAKLLTLGLRPPW